MWAGHFNFPKLEMMIFSSFTVEETTYNYFTGQGGLVKYEVLSILKDLKKGVKKMAEQQDGVKADISDVKLMVDELRGLQMNADASKLNKSWWKKIWYG